MIVPISHYQINPVFKLLYPYYLIRAYTNHNELCAMVIRGFGEELDKFPVEYFEDYNYEWKIQGYG